MGVRGIISLLCGNRLSVLGVPHGDYLTARFMEKQEKNSLCKEFALRFAEAIRQRGVKQKELATAVNIREQTLSRYKSGDRIPDSAELYRLAKFFGVTMDWLLGDDEPLGENKWKKRALAAESRLEQILDVLPLLGEVNAKLTKIASGKE